MASTQDNISNSVVHFIGEQLQGLGVQAPLFEPLRILIILILMFLICFLADWISRKIILKVIKRVVLKTKNDWDDVLLHNKVFSNFAHLVAPLILESIVPVLLEGHESWIDFGLVLSHLYFVVVVLMLLLSLIKSGEQLLSRHAYMKDKPTGSYAQLARIIMYITAGIYIVSILLDKSPWGIFSALGAMSVVVMLVFKDTILGFVASIQLAANDMVKIGDWIEFPKYGADGNVIEIKLQSIKVRNWDKTFTTVPTYAFVSDAFKNWRGMEESEGRRIKRSVFIDMNTIKICDKPLLDRLSKIELIKSYLKEKQSEIGTEDIDTSEMARVNNRALTNIGTYRAYVKAYLQNRQDINKELTFLVRQLQPTEKGLPLEIYVFSKEKRWAHYEEIQSDIFDHLLSVIDQFDLKLFQSPSGSDFSKVLN